MPNVIYLRSNLYICVLCGQVVLVTDKLLANQYVAKIVASGWPHSAICIEMIGKDGCQMLPGRCGIMQIGRMAVAETDVLPFVM